ncbi:hypothetical protein KAR91_65185 [Candidatus Pacearchaeota archaeon]|nr:hypothetical protein [Candidatus Pacearchaeota archaeon]
MRKNPEWQIKTVTKQKRRKGTLDYRAIAKIGTIVDSEMDNPKWKQIPVSISNFDRHQSVSRRR